MTPWVALFAAQVRLVAARRVDLHRRLGVLGAALAAMILVVGPLTAIAAARRGVTPGPPPLVLLSVPLGDIVVLAGLVGTALALRRNDVPRRLMLLSYVGLLPPAIARLPFAFIQTGGPLAFFGPPDLFLLACVAYDVAKHRRLHPALGGGRRSSSRRSRCVSYWRERPSGCGLRRGWWDDGVSGGRTFPTGLVPGGGPRALNSKATRL